MAELRSTYQYETNAAHVASEISRLADLAEDAADYHSQIFQKCNIIRSFAASLKRPHAHADAFRDLECPIEALRNWQPDDESSMPDCPSPLGD